MGERVADETTIAAPIDTVWDVIADVAAYPEWTEGIEEATVLSVTDDGYPHQARFKVDAKVTEVTYTIEYSYDDYDVHWHLVEAELLSQLDGSYLLREQDGGTHVRYQLEVDLALPLPVFMRKRAARTILEQGLRSLRTRAEEVD